jgi:riboflavin-specific deaminase-like protein
MRPRVLCNMATSLDGKIAPTRRDGPFVMSRGVEDGRRMRALRSRSDAVVIGATNLRVDDPDLMPSRLRVIVTRSGDQVDPGAKAFGPELGGEAIVAHASTMPQQTRAVLRPRVTLVELGASQVDLARLLDWLGSERGCRVVLCEGGGIINAGFFAARAIDELHVTVVPRLLGGSLAPTIVEGPGGAPDTFPDARLAGLDRVGDELFLSYTFDWSRSTGTRDANEAAARA